MIKTIQFFEQPEITADQLRAWAGNERTARGIAYQASMVKRVAKTDKDGDPVVILAFIVRAMGSKQYQVILEAKANPVEGEPLRLKVYCSCPDALYRTCYGLNKLGAWYRSSATDARCAQALNTPPTVVTPAGSCCKHVLAACYELGQNMQWLNA